MASPTSRSLEVLREAGWLCEVVEKWNQWSKTRKDLYGFIDILAVKRGEILGVQATSDSNVSARVKKIAEHENVGQVRESGIRIEVWGWKKGKYGWQVRVVDVS